MTLARLASVLAAQPRGDGSWFAADCPECRTRWALALTKRGAECRYDGCRWSTRDNRTVLAKWLARAGRNRAQIERVLEHLSRYDVILMLRAIWRKPGIHYQLLDVPINILKMIETAVLEPVGRRKGRRSLGADVHQGGQKLFRVHFDGADGKCQVRNLPVSQCRMLLDWDLQLHD